MSASNVLLHQGGEKVPRMYPSIPDLLGKLNAHIPQSIWACQKILEQAEDPAIQNLLNALQAAQPVVTQVLASVAANVASPPAKPPLLVPAAPLAATLQPKKTRATKKIIQPTGLIDLREDILPDPSILNDPERLRALAAKNAKMLSD